MKRDMMEIICCPVCKSELALEVKKENDAEVLSGSLMCKKCNHTYRIEDGIPNLLPPGFE
ncbi:MAG: hypothetical protein AYK23_02350 [Candidatus Proteinoplasmatales archaeon SG8-5]|nr:MAG: hypothetical protein AYK23_02350 [Candidatus Proteinoplasmatales archaeon SG8-5]